MTRLTRLALDHTPITILLMLLVLVGGIVALGSLNQELIPNIEFPQATVLTIWPGASAEEVTLGVTSPIEDAMEAIEEVEVVSVSSQTSESFSAVTVRADYGTTQEDLRDAINKELDGLDLPEDVQEPEILLFDFGAIPVASLSVSADIETDALQETVEADVIPPLEMIDGVAEVTLVGGGDDQLRVTVDPERMAAAGVTVDSIRNVLSANNLSLPAGTLSTNGESIPVQVSNRITGTEALRSLVIAPAGPPGGMPAPAVPETGSMQAMPEDDPELPPIWQVLGAQRASQVTPEMMRLASEELPDAVSALSIEEVDALRLDTLEALPEAVIDDLPEDVRTRVLARLGEEAEAAPTEAAAPEAEGGPAAGGRPVTLGDVATIERVTTSAETINRTDGQPSLGLLISKEQSANTVTVVNEILDEVEVLEEDLGLSFNVVFEQGSFIEESLRAVRDEGLLGAVFAVLVILVFLSFSVRSTIVIALSIPLSILAAFLLMRIQGLTINLLTLGGLTIAIGRVVDDAIVVLENIFRHIQRGDDRLASVLEGTREVATAVTSSTLVAVAVFLPLGFIGGITSEFFLPFALTTTYALLASLVVAITVVPVLSKMFLSRDVLPEERETWLQRLYTPSLEWALDHRWLTLVLAVAFFLLSLIPLRFVPQTFLPEFGEPSLTIDVHLPPGTDLETTDSFAREVEALLEADEDIETVETSVGRGRQVFGAAGGNDTSQATFFATFATEDRNFVDRLTDDEELVPTDVADRIRASLAELTGEREITYTVSTAAGTGFDSGVYDLQILSDDEGALREANALVLAALRDPTNWEAEESFLDRFRDEDDSDETVVPILNLSSNLTEARPVLAVSVDPAAALERGLTTAQVGFALRQVLEEQELGELDVRENGDTATLEIVVVYPEDTIASTEGLADYQLSGPMGPVRLGDVATVERRPGPVEITRVDGERAAIISGEITDEDTFGVVAQADGIIDDLDFEDRFGEDVVEVGAGVESSQQQEGFRDMLVALPISILIVYLIMVVTFRSLVHPFTILLSLPFAVSGAIIALWITSRALSVSSLIGLMMLIGIVVANAIVLIDLVQQYRERGMDARTALVRGGRTRLRPILMTAAATVLALTPQALEITGKGGLIASELATTVIGGLVTSTLLTLIVIPVVYSLLDPISRRGDRPGQLVPPPPPPSEPDSSEALPSGVV